MDWATKFLTIVQMIPAIIGLVKQVETAIPGSGQGKHKLDVVLNTVNTAATAVPEIQQQFKEGELNGIVTSITNATVATLNTAGVFTR